MQPNNGPNPSENEHGYEVEIDDETKEMIEEIKEETPTFEPRDLDDETYIEDLSEQLQETFDVDEERATRVAELACQAQNDDRFGGSSEEREETSGGALLSDPDYVHHHITQAAGSTLEERWNKCIDDWGFVHSVSVEDYHVE